MAYPLGLCVRDVSSNTPLPIPVGTDPATRCPWTYAVHRGRRLLRLERAVRRLTFAMACIDDRGAKSGRVLPNLLFNPLPLRLRHRPRIRVLVFGYTMALHKTAV